MSAVVVALAVTAGPVAAADGELETRQSAEGRTEALMAQREHLAQLSLVQSRAEIKAISSGPAPSMTLVDPDTGEQLAAMRLEPKVSPQAISTRIIGCQTTDACITRTDAVRIGFYGTGT
ncbi:hypothetical protein [Homoserinibacter sp. YIM 151385]|uniref:hypothetical protein n=1 Tax=Homoserinibacter sp. YIM 151385 TaxID=2985506 RepID=UPI0022F0E65F|nr:hypothetical protein [Homoserinibacter sp. YIM 151385]WBU37456.1 hypothetical protein OF852_11105 [Homoserinibacter sp. YIM 151385]